MPAIAPCQSCERGWYQPDMGASSCIRCPAGVVNSKRAATSLQECGQLPSTKCSEGFCLNNGTCSTATDVALKCDCPEGFIGTCNQYNRDVKKFSLRSKKRPGLASLFSTQLTYDFDLKIRVLSEFCIEIGAWESFSAFILFYSSTSISPSPRSPSFSCSSQFPCRQAGNTMQIFCVHP